MAVKRRVVWIADEDWAAIKTLADAHDMTISYYIKGRILGDVLLAPSKPPALTTQAQRDAILRRVNRAG